MFNKGVKEMIVIPAIITRGLVVKWHVLTDKLQGHIDNRLTLSNWFIRPRLNVESNKLVIQKLEDLKEFLTEKEYLEFQKEIFEKII